MAINPEAEYPGRIEPSSPEYPYGAIRDESIEGAEDGTPLQQSWARDIQGFFQALLTRAAIVPSGDADTALVSDYMDALTGEGTPIIPLDALAPGGATITSGSLTMLIDCLAPSSCKIRMTNTSNDTQTDLSPGLAQVADTDAHNATSLNPDFVEYKHGTYGTADPARSMEMTFDIANTGWASSPTDGWYGRTTNKTLDGIASGTRIKSVSISFGSAFGGQCGPVACQFTTYLGWVEIAEMKAQTWVSPAIGTDIKLHVVFDPTDTGL